MPSDVVTRDCDANTCWGVGMRDQGRVGHKEFPFSVIGRKVCSAIET